jgi:ribose transport system permease protein
MVSSRMWARTVDLLTKGGVWWIVLGLAVIGVLAVPTFASTENLENLLRQGAALGIVAVAQMIVVLIGGIDLSVGALMGLVVVIANATMNGDPAAIPIAILIACALGLVTGLFNGLLVVLTRVNPLILTFGMLSILQGAIFVYTDRTVGSSPPEFSSLAYGSILGIPPAALLLVVVLVVARVVLASTTIGRTMYAVGGNADHARRAGVPTRRVVVGAYVACSLIAVLAGLVLAARLGTGYTLAGTGFTIDSVVVVVLGGTSLAGGRGTIPGLIAGLLVLSLLENVLNLLGVSAYVQQMVLGAAVVIAVAAAHAPSLRAQTA